MVQTRMVTGLDTFWTPLKVTRGDQSALIADMLVLCCYTSGIVLEVVMGEVYEHWLTSARDNNYANSVILAMYDNDAKIALQILEGYRP